MITDEREIESVAGKAQLAAVLEVCSPKPGNVSPLHDFHDTSFEQFLAGALAIKDAIHEACLSGFDIAKQDRPLSEISMGEKIKKGILDVDKSHSGGNTHLGILMLAVPIAASAGICIAKKIPYPEGMKKYANETLKNTTSSDSVALYDAINLAKAGGTGRENLDEKTKDLDLSDGESVRLITERNITLLKLMELSSEKDRIAWELFNSMHITFDIGAPMISSVYSERGSVKTAVVQAFLAILSRYPDTLIARKAGMHKAREVSAEAAEILALGGMLTDKGQRAISTFDKMLRVEKNRFNPGTTADLVTSSLFVSLLRGLEI
jgi:triphosphoribosyl-dephospho-CoA synthase